jgi:hypothetical protein
MPFTAAPDAGDNSVDEAVAVEARGLPFSMTMAHVAGSIASTCCSTGPDPAVMVSENGSAHPDGAFKW